MTLTLWWGINIALTALIIRWARTIDKRMRALKKYEFEHRTDGGVVQFSSFEASEEHNRQKRAAQLAQGGRSRRSQFHSVPVGLCRGVLSIRLPSELGALGR